MTRGGAPICFLCRHRDEWEADGIGVTCRAFPDGIPDSILVEGGNHFDPVKGDNGIQFEALEDGPDPRVEPELHPEPVEG